MSRSRFKAGRGGPPAHTGHARRPFPSPARADVAALLGQAVALHQAGRLAEAEPLYRQVLQVQPRHFDGLHLLGVVHYQRGDLQGAVRQIDAALRINPDVAAAHNNRGNALKDLGRPEEALASFERAIALKPDYAEAFYNRGNTLRELERFADAVASYDRAIALRPDYAAAFSNRGSALKELERFDEALASYDRATALKPDYAEAFYNRANALDALNRHEEALADCERAIALKPDLAEAHNNRGNALKHLRRLNEALEAYERALALRPDYADALANHGSVLLGLQRADEAVVSFGKAHEIDPDQDHLKGKYLFARMLLCDWAEFDLRSAEINTAVANGIAATYPFQLLACASTPAAQLQCARTFVANTHSPYREPVWRGERYAHQRIRVAYVSSDLRDHPVAHLSAGLFARHDRSRFEVTAISFGDDIPSAIRARMKASFDRFIDANQMSDRETVRMIRDLEIDIAVDLNGFTDGSRPEVFAQKPAPVQVNYLGYAGTLGQDHYDYIIADRFVISEAAAMHYAEKVVYLPDSFMVNDAERKISAHRPSRVEAGLPESGFVFCCFNNAYKITPDVFDVWMRLLAGVDGSVLWLSTANTHALDNLRREAAKRGIAPERLVFAPKVALNEDHLARVSLADLFLDTLYYNAHTTAADALWAGVPVVTCAGGAFASRVAGSLLAAVGLPELITASVPDYEALALRLARDPDQLSAVRQKLARNRDVYPLFDTARFTRHLEAAYTNMWERAERGERPRSFAVDSIERPAQ
jgi:predicted O-linked N-acetylglucosamine transferase (SPINDLY family)